MADFVCPLCSARYTEHEYSDHLIHRRNICKLEHASQDWYASFYCRHYDKHFAIEWNIYKIKYGQENIERLLDLATEHLIRQESCVVGSQNRRWHFYYSPMPNGREPNDPEYVNLAGKMLEYPTQALDVAQRTLLNLSILYPRYGHSFHVQEADHRLFYERSGGNAPEMGIIPLLMDFQFIKPGIKLDSYTFTAQGWQKIDELRKQEQTIRQGFIAMSFHEEATPIRVSFCEAIRRSGYAPMILDEKEHNNQIVPEIFYEIRRSKFAVVDVTYPNYGAYYEAGFAQALGKPVIICCQKQVYESSEKRPHFDIAQQSIVVWETHEELIARLKRRIEATVQ